MRALAVLALLVVPGCLAPLPEAPDPAAGAAAASLVRLLDDGRAEVEVPVDVHLVGFPADVAAALSDALEPLPIEQAWKEDWRDVPPDATRPPHAPSFTDAMHALPLMPVARFRVLPVSADLEAEVLASEAAATGDGNALEDLLAERLAPDARRPAIVLLHADALGPHAWKYTYANGWLENVRFFGERAPLLVLDVSAEADPWVVERNSMFDPVLDAALKSRLLPPQPYDRPLPATTASVPALADLVRDAARWRVLQGAIYPPTLRPCHAATLVLAIREDAATERLPGLPRAGESFDAESLRRGWENLTGEANVHVDTKVIRLPQDDPVLDAATRVFAGATGGIVGGHDPLRAWVDANWERYWVAHDGCEAYVSFVIYGNARDDAGGIAMYDASDGRRVSVSGAGDGGRLRERGASEGAYAEVALLFSHETGHLFGQNHPHNEFTPDGSRVEHRSFSAVWSPMSYQVGDRTVDFGAVERANFLRNQAGFALAAARDAGTDEAAHAPALADLAAQDWAAATAKLVALIPASRT